jgi:probable HAF family extracellular repeat protein
VVDLNPSGFAVSQALGVSGGQQVGSGSPVAGGSTHALLWTGSAASVVDLHSFLPAGFTDSVAIGIDSDGNIVGWAGPASGGQIHAFLWQPVPEPSTLTLLGLGLAGLAAALRRKR